MTVVATLEMIARTSEQDRREHPVEYPPAPPAVA
jgi:hypothetical protein